jgi:hypothetical protein
MKVADRPKQASKQNNKIGSVIVDGPLQELTLKDEAVVPFRILHDWEICE